MKILVKKQGMRTGVQVMLIIFAFIAAIFLTAGICLTVFANHLLGSATSVVDSFGKMSPEIAKVIPAYAAVDSADKGNTAVGTLLALNYVNADASVEGSFKGRFTTKQERVLEKVDLSCIDEYAYQIIEVTPATNGYDKASQKAKEQVLENNGCELTNSYSDTPVGNVASAKSYNLWKCPLRNCALKEVDSEVSGQFIPETVDLTKVSAKSGGKN